MLHHVYRLPGMMNGEKIIKIFRRSFFVFFKQFFSLIVLALMPVGLGSMLMQIFPGILADPFYYALIVLAGSAYYLFIWLFLFFGFIDFYLDIFVITNERLIIIKQDGFFARNISEQHIDRVQDVTSEVEGVVRTLFRFGNISVQTASEEEKIFFKDVSSPEAIRDIIIRAANEKRNLLGRQTAHHL